MTDRELFVSALQSAPLNSVERLIGDKLTGSDHDATLVYLQQVMSGFRRPSRQWIVANALWRVMRRQV